MTSSADVRSSIPPIVLFDYPSRQREDGRPSRLELCTLIHVAGLIIFTAWDFGGETDLARIVISWWGSLALPIMVYASLRRLDRRDGLPAALYWLWPLVLFDVLILASTLNPSFTHAFVGGANALVHNGAKTDWPSCAQPGVSLYALWLFNAIYLTCFNLALVVVHRRVLRVLLLLLVSNALLLAVMGTFQKLDGASGLFFGLQRSPNEAFFASFIYHNHWGAFILLATAAALGLLFHHARREHRDGQRHSPALFGLIATLFLAASVPLSTSRSCTLLLLMLLAGALLHWLWLLRRRRQADGRPVTAAGVLAVAVFLAGLGGIYLLGRPVITARLDKTREQIGEIRLHGSLGSRAQLYADTWRMAREKIWFGWGLGSYATVFQIFNQQVSVEGWVPFYAQAHSDWLQSLAEVGLVGTVLVALLGLVPLVTLFRSGPPGVVPSYLLAGCGLLALYAWVEFPFANPAVMEVFWLCLFSAVRYHKLTLGGA
ncbi:MAG: O-antigen ligase family protein [Opitutaceae bacterium]|nr:O-antigen ligase family protein [Opitutaceae bacterium]